MAELGLAWGGTGVVGGWGGGRSISYTHIFRQVRHNYFSPSRTHIFPPSRTHIYVYILDSHRRLTAPVRSYKAQFEAVKRL